MSSINYQTYGEGETIILIHGFPFNNTIWNSFATSLSESFKVLTIDLPGFGKSPILKSPFTIDNVAEAILVWLLEKNIHKSVLIGHSLGGYIALSMAAKSPQSFSGVGLFHSTAYPDSEEKKKSRLKVIDFIDKNGVMAFTANFIEPLFCEPGHPSIKFVKQIAMQSSTEAVKNYTMAMHNRPDRTDVIEKYKKPFLFIAGEKDNGISVDSIEKQSLTAFDTEVHVLEHVAHMGMFEQPTKTIKIVNTFARKCFQ